MSKYIDEQSVYDYVKNFCYDPIYRTEVVVLQYDKTTDPPTPPDLTQYPFQFSETTYYVPGAYCVYNGVLYVAIAEGAGHWTVSSIANRYLGDGDSLREDPEYAEYLSNVEDRGTGGYNSDRFKPVEIPINYGLEVIELYNRRDNTFEIAFNNMANARAYIRMFAKLTDYDIRVYAGGYETSASFVGDGSTASFALPGVPGQIISVEIDFEPTEDYIISDNTITFNTAPDAGTTIKITYTGADYSALWDNKTMVFYD